MEVGKHNRHAYPQPEFNVGILNQYGVSGVWSQPADDLNVKKTEAGTRPEHLFVSNMRSQVHGLNLKRKVRDLSRTYPQPIWGPRCVVTGAWSRPEKDGDEDKAGALILNQYGGPRCVVST